RIQPESFSRGRSLNSPAYPWRVFRIPRPGLSGTGRGLCGQNFLAPRELRDRCHALFGRKAHRVRKRGSASAMDDIQLSPTPTTVMAPPRATPSAPGAPTRTRAWVLPVGIAALGLLTAAPIYVWIAILQSQDHSAAALSMPTMNMNRMGVF